MRRGKITANFQCLECVLIEDTKGVISPEKFRDVRETGPRSLASSSILLGLPGVGGTGKVCACACSIAGLGTAELIFVFHCLECLDWRVRGDFSYKVSII